MLKIGERIQLTIHNLAAGGRGVGRHESLVIFVQDAAPNEHVVAEITRVKKNFAEAKLIEVLTPSPHRVRPVCEVFGRCGGCAWQHITYEEQLRQKQMIVTESLRKFAGRGSVSVLPIVPSPSQLHYRNRVQLHYARGRVGFFSRGTHELVPIQRCWITDERLNREFAPLRESLLRSGSAPTRKQLYLREDGTVSESDFDSDSDLGFSQVNEAQNRNLIETVLRHIDPDSAAILDLYAGHGNFSFPAFQAFDPPKQIWAVELSRTSVRRGKAKAETLEKALAAESAPRDAPGRAQCPRFIEAAVEEFLSSVLSAKAPGLRPALVENSTVILDPPRNGCDRAVIEALLRLRPRRILYISCDPVTLSRDLGQLPADAYMLHSVQPFDMFPQTAHVEVMVRLDRL